MCGYWGNVLIHAGSISLSRDPYLRRRKILLLGMKSPGVTHCFTVYYIPALYPSGTTLERILFLASSPISHLTWGPDGGLTRVIASANHGPRKHEWESTDHLSCLVGLSKCLPVIAGCLLTMASSSGTFYLAWIVFALWFAFAVIRIDTA